MPELCSFFGLYNMHCNSLLHSSAVYAHPGISEAGDVGRPADVPGNVGWAPLPGSAVVLDRATGQLTPCTPSLCLHSHRERVWTYTPATVLAANTSGTQMLGSTLPAYPHLASSSLEEAGVVRGSEVKRVNRAPFTAQVCCVLTCASACLGVIALWLSDENQAHSMCAFASVPHCHSMHKQKCTNLRQPLTPGDK